MYSSCISIRLSVSGLLAEHMLRATTDYSGGSSVQATGLIQRLPPSR